MSGSSSTSSNPRLTTLMHLQEYATHCEAGNTELKSCLWQLTKSRRSKSRGMLGMEEIFHPDNVREEFPARTLVMMVDDDDDDEKAATAWRLIDVLEEQTRDKENAPAAAASKKEADSAPMGLRQRKNHSTTAKQQPDQTTKKEEWTLVDEEEPEEWQLQKIKDPLELFAGGMAPRELKVAQQKAKKSLESYIQAANQAAAILALLQAQKGNK